VKVKICGITRPEDADAAVAAGADFIGLNFWPKSKRYVTHEQGARIADAVRGAIRVVGVFVDATAAEIEAAAHTAGLEIVQLHGQVADVALPTWSLDPARHDEILVLDQPQPGSGQTIDWPTAAAIARRRRVLLAGGLTPENVLDAVRIVTPWGVDVASGVESAPGIKDAERVAAFVAAARGSLS
jgi:phosphoribosylanthranilate isomerase